MPLKPEPLDVRLWRHVNKTDSCWIWTGTLNKPGGYGTMGVRSLGRTVYVHRLSWELHNGPIPDGLLVCHNCPGGDNPRCVNPAHLYLGTQLENITDAKNKGRLPTGKMHYFHTRPELQHLPVTAPERIARGDRHGLRLHPERVARGEAAGQSRLTEAKVLAIRERYAQGGISQKALAIAFNIGQASICEIVNRKRWKHI